MRRIGLSFCATLVLAVGLASCAESSPYYYRTYYYHPYYYHPYYGDYHRCWRCW